MPEFLDISPLNDTLTELEKMYAKAHAPEVLADVELSSYMRTAVIKGFEYSYEMSYKSLRRFIDIYGPSHQDEGSEYGFRDLLRLGQEYKVINSVDKRLFFREKRNITSHTYEKSKAADIFSIIPDFLRHARALYNSLTAKLAKDR